MSKIKKYLIANEWGSVEVAVPKVTDIVGLRSQRELVSQTPQPRTVEDLRALG